MTSGLYIFCAINCLLVLCAATSVDNNSPLCLNADHRCKNFDSAIQCNAVKQCIDTVWRTDAFRRQHLSDNSCSSCTDQINVIRNAVNSSIAKDILESLLDTICTPLDVFCKPCENLIHIYVTNHINDLLDLINSSLDPYTICHILGFCFSVTIESTKHGNMANVLFNNVELHFPASYLESPELIESTSSQKADPCVNCTIAFTYIKQYMKSASKNEVFHRMLEMCGSLSSFSDGCATLLTANFDEYYPIALEIEPPASCYMSGMCSRYLHLDETEILVPPKTDALQCDLCKLLVSHFKETLITNTTEEQLLSALQGLCQQTGKFKDDCLKIVTEDISIIYDFLTKELEPSTFCADIYLCPSTKPRITDQNLNLISDSRLILTDVSLPIAMDQSPAPLNDSVECELCKYLIKLIQKQLDDPDVEHEIADIVKEVCSIVPDPERTNCQKFIDKYSDLIIQLLSQGTSPQAVCQLIDVCLGSLQSHAYELCSFCQYILHYVQTEVEDPTTEHDIKHALKKICQIVPETLKQPCKKFINRYSAQIISIFAEKVDPSVVCPALKLCPSAHPPKQRCDYCKYSLNKLISNLEDRQEQHIKTQLNSLVASSPKYMAATTVELKVQHFEQVVDMMVAEFGTEESCVYLKFCEVGKSP